MKIEFVNRTKEFIFLEEQSVNISITNSIVLLCGETGVGKSELTRVFMDHNKVKVPTIKVPIQQAEKNAYTSGHYITKLAQLLNELSKTDSRIRSLASFFKLGNKSDALTKKK